jgi:hypothetical protein
MDPITLVVTAGAYVAAEVARKSADSVIEAAYKRLKSYVLAKLGQTASGRVDPEVLRRPEIATDPQVQGLSREVLARSSALRRAELVAAAVRGARVLWVDDVPGNNRSECQLLTALGLRVDQVRSTAEALTALASATYDLILSDMARDEESNAGLRMLGRLGGGSPPVVFYVGCVDESRSAPRGSFGIADQPESLLHLVLDVLERRRV